MPTAPPEPDPAPAAAVPSERDSAPRPESASRAPELVEDPPLRGGRRMPEGLRRYLGRELAYSARHLDHGVLQLALAGGWPHRYRVELGLGLLDHLSLGVTAHWLPRAPRPQWTPKVAVAFYRLPVVEFGAWYTQTLFPPPKNDANPETPSFQERAHWILGTMSFSHRWLSAGLDAGAVRGIEIDEGLPLAEDGTNPQRVRWRFGGGMHLRAGTRRWGFTANVLLPYLTIEAAVDVRFGLFEVRPRDGWRPSGIVTATDRRPPKWRAR